MNEEVERNEARRCNKKYLLRNLQTDLWVFKSMFLSDAVPAQGVVIEAGILHHCDPLSPARGNVSTVILIQILPEECWENTHRESTVLIHHFRRHFGVSESSGDNKLGESRTRTVE